MTYIFISLRGAVAYAVITQVWLIVYAASLRRVQGPTNLQVRRPNAVTRKLLSGPKKMACPVVAPAGGVDIHNDSGYRRLTGDADDEEKGYGIRGASLLRRGNTQNGTAVMQLVDAYCKVHRLQVRSKYSAETLASAQHLEDCYPAVVTRREFKMGAAPPPEELKNVLEKGGLCIKVFLTIDDESVF